VQQIKLNYKSHCKSYLVFFIKYKQLKLESQNTLGKLHLKNDIKYNEYFPCNMFLHGM